MQELAGVPGLKPKPLDTVGTHKRRKLALHWSGRVEGEASYMEASSFHHVPYLSAGGFPAMNRIQDTVCKFR